MSTLNMDFNFDIPRKCHRILYMHTAHLTTWATPVSEVRSLAECSACFELTRLSASNPQLTRTRPRPNLLLYEHSDHKATLNQTYFHVIREYSPSMVGSRLMMQCFNELSSSREACNPSATQQQGSEIFWTYLPTTVSLGKLRILCKPNY